MMKNALFLLISLMLFCSCNKGEESVLYFVGDSMIANWDVEASFPNHVTKNLGRDSSHSSYLNSVSLPYKNADVVVLIGTNDLHGGISDAELSVYCEDYESKLCQIGGGRILVVSILPTSNKDKNNVICKFNKEICRRIEAHANMVFVDCYNVFMDDGGLIKEDLSRDGIHLNDYGYILLGDQIKPFL